MDNKHVKLVGGSVNTAKHDLEKMKAVREIIAKINKEEKSREKKETIPYLKENTE